MLHAGSDITLAKKVALHGTHELLQDSSSAVVFSVLNKYLQLARLGVPTIWFSCAYPAPKMLVTSLAACNQKLNEPLSTSIFHQSEAHTCYNKHGSLKMLSHHPLLQRPSPNEKKHSDATDLFHQVDGFGMASNESDDRKHLTGQNNLPRLFRCKMLMSLGSPACKRKECSKNYRRSYGWKRCPDWTSSS